MRMLLETIVMIAQHCRYSEYHRLKHFRINKPGIRELARRSRALPAPPEVCGLNPNTHVGQLTPPVTVVWNPGPFSGL